MKRVLAIDPIGKGFGYAVLDGQNFLFDWGIKVNGQGRESRENAYLRQVGDLIDLCHPDRIIVEDCLHHGCRRGKRSRRLIEQTIALGETRGIVVRRVSWRRVSRILVPAGGGTKHKIALAVARRFPELAFRLPPMRKPWMSEHTRMAIFDAVALALAFYGARRSRREEPTPEAPLT